MKTLLYSIAKFIAVVVPIFLFVGGTLWFCNRLVGGSDPIMHPFIYTGPIALIFGVLTSWVCFLIVSDQEARSNRRTKERTSGE